jgi:hypothetical protein
MDKDKLRLRSPYQTLMAARIIQAWRFSLWETVNDLGEFDLGTEEGRELWLAKSRKYSPADAVKGFPPVPFADMTWGVFDDGMRALKKSAKAVVRTRRAPRSRPPSNPPL